MGNLGYRDIQLCDSPTATSLKAHLAEIAAGVSAILARQRGAWVGMFAVSADTAQRIQKALH